MFLNGITAGHRSIDGLPDPLKGTVSGSAACTTHEILMTLLNAEDAEEECRESHFFYEALHMTMYKVVLFQSVSCVNV